MTFQQKLQGIPEHNGIKLRRLHMIAAMTGYLVEKSLRQRRYGSYFSFAVSYLVDIIVSWITIRLKAGGFRAPDVDEMDVGCRGRQEIMPGYLHDSRLVWPRPFSASDCFDGPPLHQTDLFFGFIRPGPWSIASGTQLNTIYVEG